jgi:hypothetical protein
MTLCLHNAGCIAYSESSSNNKGDEHGVHVVDAGEGRQNSDSIVLLECLSHTANSTSNSISSTSEGSEGTS